MKKLLQKIATFLGKGFLKKIIKLYKKGKMKTIEKIIEWVLNLIFLGFGKKLKGFRTIIINAVTGLVAVFELFTGKLVDLLCGAGLENFCDYENTKMAATLVLVVNILNIILRKFTDTPIGENQ